MRSSLVSAMHPLPHRLTFTMVDCRPVFMDVSDDSYFLLESDDESEFLRTYSGDDDASVGERLRQALGSSTDRIERVRCKPPRLSLLDEPAPADRVRVTEIARALVLLTWIRRSLARKPIGLVLHGVAVGGDRTDFDDAPAQAELAARFIAARRLAPIKPNCLLDSIALIHWLGGAAASASLVFGVKLAPFAAHCWVQSETHLLNDRSDHVGRFAPVRVIPCSAAMR